MDVRVFKLVSGEEILAEIVNYDGSIVIKNPLIVVMAPTQEGIGIRLIPWLPFIEKDTEIAINGNKLIFVPVEPKDDLLNGYKSQFGGVVAPSKNLFVP